MLKRNVYVGIFIVLVAVVWRAKAKCIPKPVENIAVPVLQAALMAACESPLNVPPLCAMTDEGAPVFGACDSLIATIDTICAAADALPDNLQAACGKQQLAIAVSANLVNVSVDFCSADGGPAAGALRAACNAHSGAISHVMTAACAETDPDEAVSVEIDADETVPMLSPIDSLISDLMSSIADILGGAGGILGDAGGFLGGEATSLTGEASCEEAGSDATSSDESGSDESGSNDYSSVNSDFEGYSSNDSDSDDSDSDGSSSDDSDSDDSGSDGSSSDDSDSDDSDSDGSSSDATSSDATSSDAASSDMTPAVRPRPLGNITANIRRGVLLLRGK